MTDNLPPGFRPITGKRAPPDSSKRYYIHLRCGFTDMKNAYEPRQLVWIWNGGAGDILGVMEVG